MQLYASTEVYLLRIHNVRTRYTVLMRIICTHKLAIAHAAYLPYGTQYDVVGNYPLQLTNLLSAGDGQ